MTHALLSIAIVCATLQQGVPPKVAPKDAPAADPAQAKREAFLADVAAQALASDLALLERLDGRFGKAVSFRDAPAGDVLKAIKDAIKAPIEIDVRAVGESGGWALKPVSYEGASIRSALDAVLRAISPEYETYVVDVAAGLLVITDPDGQRRLRTQAQYAFGPLLQRMATMEGAPSSSDDLPRMLADYLAAGSEDAWSMTGGETVTIEWTGPVATIDAPPSYHHDIRRRVARLEQALPAATLQWSIRVVEIGAGLDSASIDGAVASPEALEKLVKDGSARVVSAPRLLAAATEPAEMRIDGDGRTLEVRVEPSRGAEGRVFVVRMTERTTKGAADGAAAVRTIALRALPGIRSVGVMEIDGKRLMLEAIGRSREAAELLRGK